MKITPLFLKKVFYRSLTGGYSLFNGPRYTKGMPQCNNENRTKENFFRLRLVLSMKTSLENSC